MTRDEQDDRLDRLLGMIRTPAPTNEMVDRIVAFATAQPQQAKRKPLGAFVHQVLGGLLADWPHGLAYKAGFLVLVAAITFGTGIGQGFDHTTSLADDDLSAIIFGDFTGTL